jgi:hypothetical protein
MGFFRGSRRLEDALRDQGRCTTAEITAAKRTPWLNSSGGEAIGGRNATVTWRLQVRITPDGDAPFEAKLTEAVPPGDELCVGQAIAVLYDPNDQTRVAIDHGPRGLIVAFKGGLSADAAAAIDDAGAGAAVQSLIADAESGPTAVEAGWRSDPAGEVAAFRSGMTAHPALGGRRLSSVSSIPGPGAGPSDRPEDRIAKLADLRDRGALTAAEFDKQKKQILGD